MESPRPQQDPAPLERFPLHIFELICSYVPRRSLPSLSLASSLCYKATTPRRFESLRLTIRDRETLRDDLQRRTVILAEGNRFRHVRRITLVGFMLDGEESDAGPASRNHDGDDDSDSNSDFDENPPFPYSDPAMTEQYKRAQAEAWLPFVEFVAQFPALKTWSMPVPLRCPSFSSPHSTGTTPEAGSMYAPSASAASTRRGSSYTTSTRTSWRWPHRPASTASGQHAFIAIPTAASASTWKP